MAITSFIVFFLNNLTAFIIEMQNRIYLFLSALLHLLHSSFLLFLIISLIVFMIIIQKHLFYMSTIVISQVLVKWLNS